MTGANGKTSTTHRVAAMLRAAGHGVLTESTVGYFLNEQQLPSGSSLLLEHAALVPSPRRQRSS